MRVGKKNQPKFRLILIDSKKASRSGAFFEILGTYDPISKKIEFKKDRVEYWRSKGAQISPTALQLSKKN